MKKVILILVFLVSLVGYSQNPVYHPGGVRMGLMSSAPSSPYEGQYYYNSTDKVLYIYDGTSWNGIGSQNGEVHTTNSSNAGLGHAGILSTHDDGGAFSFYATNSQTTFRFDEDYPFIISSESRANITGGSTAGDEVLKIDRTVGDYAGIFTSAPLYQWDVNGKGRYRDQLIVQDATTDSSAVNIRRGNELYLTSDVKSVPISTANITTLQTYGGKTLVLDSSVNTITLSDDAGLNSDYQVYFLNTSGGDVTWLYGTSDSDYIDGTALVNVPDGQYAYCFYLGSNDWKVVVGGTGGGGGGGTDDQVASEVPFTPTGNTTSSNVQAAIEEVQTELDGVSSGGIGGSIADNQIAVGASTSDEIEGSSGLTWNGSTLTITGNTVSIGSLRMNDNLFQDFGTTPRAGFRWLSGSNVLSLAPRNSSGLVGVNFSDQGVHIGSTNTKSSEYLEVGGNGKFTGTVEVANATADGHALNRITGDGRYLQSSSDLDITGHELITYSSINDYNTTIEGVSDGVTRIQGGALVAGGEEVALEVVTDQTHTVKISFKDETDTEVGSIESDNGNGTNARMKFTHPNGFDFTGGNTLIRPRYDIGTDITANETINSVDDLGMVYIVDKATDVTITIDQVSCGNNVRGKGAVITFIQKGAGKIILAEGTATVDSKTSLTSDGQWSVVKIMAVTEASLQITEWVAYGNLAP